MKNNKEYTKRVYSKGIRRVSDTSRLSREQIESLIDSGVRVGRPVGVRLSGNQKARQKRRPDLGLTPAAKHVAEAVQDRNITQAEARNLNPHYLQWMPKGFKPEKVKAPKKPKKAAGETVRIVNGREFKVTQLPENKAATERARKAESKATRAMYRPKGTKY